MPDPFERLRAPVTPVDPDPAFATRLRARLERALTLPRGVPVTAIDPVTHKVVAQFAGPGGDALRVGHGYLWLSNGRWQSTWRMLPSRIIFVTCCRPPNWW